MTAKQEQNNIGRLAVMTVLRVQNKEGKGPYVYSDPALYMQLDIIGLPTPAEDLGIGRLPHKNEYCGFKDRKQLNVWFDSGDLELLEMYDYYVVVLEATITAVGECQVLFILD